MNTTRHMVTLFCLGLALSACARQAPAGASRSFLAHPAPAFDASAGISVTGAQASQPLAAGAMAPDFRLDGLSGASVQLSAELQSSGSVVLVFFPGAYGRLGRALLETLAANQPAFDARNAHLIAVATLPAEDVAADVGASGAQFPVLVDAEGQVLRAYGVQRLLPGKPKRGQPAVMAFIVAADGRIVWSGPALDRGQLALDSLLAQLD